MPHENTYLASMVVNSDCHYPINYYICTIWFIEADTQITDGIFKLILLMKTVSIYQYPCFKSHNDLNYWVNAYMDISVTPHLWVDGLLLKWLGYYKILFSSYWSRKTPALEKCFTWFICNVVVPCRRVRFQKIYQLGVPSIIIACILYAFLNEQLLISDLLETIKTSLNMKQTITFRRC